MDETLNSILEVAPEATKQNVIEAASEILQAELVAEADASKPAETAMATVAAVLPPDIQTDELNADMQIARDNIKNVIEQGKIAIDGALELAEASETPRAYEVVATMITSIVQANKELIQLHKTRKDTLKTDKETKTTGDTPGDIHIKNAVFVGRSQELLRSLKDIEKAAEGLNA